VCRDCESSLRTASEVAESADLRERYCKRAAIWSRFCESLREEILRLGGEPRDSPGIAGVLHRAWINIKSTIGDSDAIASECVKHEDEALRCCIEAVTAGLTPAMSALALRFTEELAGSRSKPPTRVDDARE
jgi:uncharacterized protein (TIGR02284 family)